MIKGVRVGGTGQTLSYLDTLELPIIENTPNEEDLKDSMAEAMIKYPQAAGVLVRRHGIYVWGLSTRKIPLLSYSNIPQGWIGKRRKLRPK
jgi:methylthioribulose-1-phosphate dehydratase